MKKDKEIEKEVMEYKAPIDCRMTNGPSTLDVKAQDVEEFIKLGYKPIK